MNTPRLVDPLGHTTFGEGEGLQGGSDGGNSGGMEARLAKLETAVESIQRDMTEIKTSLTGLADLPKKRDLFNYTLTSIGLAIATIAIVVGGIIGGLALLRPDPPVYQQQQAAAPVSPPIIIQIPAIQQDR